jgi:hypothetical protein
LKYLKFNFSYFYWNILWLLIIVRSSNVWVDVALRFVVTMFAHSLKQHSIEVEAGIKENISQITNNDIRLFDFDNF